MRLAIVADVLVLLADRSDLDTRALRGFLWPAALAFPLALVAARVVPANALVVVAALATIVGEGGLWSATGAQIADAWRAQANPATSPSSAAN